MISISLVPVMNRLRANAQAQAHSNCFSARQLYKVAHGADPAPLFYYQRKSKPQRDSPDSKLSSAKLIVSTGLYLLNVVGQLN